MKLIKWLVSTWIGRAIIVMAVPIVGILAMRAGRSYLSPGPVSAMAKMGTGLGGYASHADFETDCLHCHEPVHCLSASKCQSCHMDVAKERAGTEGLHAMLPGTDRCQTCHKEHRGREAVISEVGLANIDHEALTGFSLAAHSGGEEAAPVTCEDCHRDNVLAATNVDCQSCHLKRDTAVAQAHVDQYGTDCTLCHDGKGDGAVVADHALYPLEGAHADKSCDDCHADHVYTGLAADCAGCHDEPASHAGQFGTDCARCHTAIAWAPAQLTHHTFQLDHGAPASEAAASGAAAPGATADPLPCTTCHPNTYAEHTCYGCHDHDPAAVLALHDEAGMKDVEACGECHKTGLADELKDLQPAASEPLASASEGAPVQREEP